MLEQAPVHGYGIIQALAMRSGGTLDVPAGTVYPALYRLESAGLIASSWDTTSGRRRRVYDLTRSGRSALRRERDDWRELSTAIGAGLDEADAEARAVDEFGTVAAVRPAFQAVLDRATARRAAIVGLCLFPLLTLFWNVAWEQNPYVTWQPASVPFLVAVAASLVALAASLGAAVVLVACRRLDGGWTWRRVDRRAHLFTIAGTWAFAVAVATVPVTNPEAVLWPPTTLVVLAATTLGLLAVPVCRPSAPGAGC